MITGVMMWAAVEGVKVDGLLVLIAIGADVFIVGAIASAFNGG